jgi:VanZ family protein
MGDQQRVQRRRALAQLVPEWLPAIQLRRSGDGDRTLRQKGNNELKPKRRSPVRLESPASRLERRITNALLWFSFILGLTLFSTMLFSHGNTFSIVEPVVRWYAPHASADTLATVHTLAREMGHFFIPTLAFWTLVLGPLRGRPIIALLVCTVFACLDEGVQTFSPDRTGSIFDVMLDTFGALFGFFVYGALQMWRVPRPAIARY